MKNLRLVTFLVFAVCAFCLPAVAQTSNSSKPKQWTYKGDNGADELVYEKDKRYITIIITQRPNGYEVSGNFKSGSGWSCSISGSYYPKTLGLRAKANCPKVAFNVTGSKIPGQDALEIAIGSLEIVAKRVGSKSTPPTGSNPTSVTKTGSDVSGVWAFVCCGGRYNGKLTLIQDGNVISGYFGDTNNGTTGDIAGQINGSAVNFRRSYSRGVQDYTLTLNSDGKTLTLTGSFTGDRDTSVGTDVKATKPAN